MSSQSDLKWLSFGFFEEVAQQEQQEEQQDKWRYEISSWSRKLLFDGVYETDKHTDGQKCRSVYRELQALKEINLQATRTTRGFLTDTLIWWLDVNILTVGKNTCKT